MAIRVRTSGKMVCAALSEALPGDTYIDDALHYHLSVEQGVICTYPMPRHVEEGGEWFWSGFAPEGCDMRFVGEGL